MRRRHEKVAEKFLSLSPRFWDILSIILLAAGINVATSADGNRSVTRLLAAGFCIMLGGVFASVLRYRSELIWSSARDTQQKATEKHSAGGGIVPNEFVEYKKKAIKETIGFRKSRYVIFPVLTMVLLLITGLAFLFIPRLMEGSSDSGQVETRTIALEKVIAVLKQDLERQFSTTTSSLLSLEKAIQNGTDVSIREQSEFKKEIDQKVQHLESSISDLKKSVDALLPKRSKGR